MHNFCFDSSRNLGRGATCGKGGGGASLEVHMNLMPPGVSKVSFFLHILDLPGGFYGRHRSLPNSTFCHLLHFCKEIA